MLGFIMTLNQIIDSCIKPDFAKLKVHTNNDFFKYFLPGFQQEPINDVIQSAIMLEILIIVCHGQLCHEKSVTTFFIFQWKTTE